MNEPRSYKTTVTYSWQGTPDLGQYFGGPAKMAVALRESLRQRPGRDEMSLKSFEPKVYWLEASNLFQVEFTVGRDAPMAVIQTAGERVLRRLRRYGLNPEDVARIEARSESV